MNYELGKSFEQLEIGEEASFAKTISETDVYLFAGIIGDFNPMHINEEYAKRARFKARVAHGGITMGLLGHIVGMKMPGLGTIANDLYVRFVRPTYIGDTITATGKIIKKNAKKKLVKVDLTFVNQQGEVVCEGWVQVIPPKTDRTGA
jgi:3-hydroxybutyryl-CoA dehydratase